jgi:hypothetical protein
MGAFGYGRPATLPHPVRFALAVESYSIVQNNSIRRRSPNRSGCKISGRVRASFPWELWREVEC